MGEPIANRLESGRIDREMVAETRNLIESVTIRLEYDRTDREPVGETKKITEHHRTREPVLVMVTHKSHVYV